MPGMAKARLFARKGTQDQAIDYCKEDGDWVEFGIRKKDSERTDLYAFRDAILAGQTDLQLADSNLGAFTRYPRLVDRLRAATPLTRTEDLHVAIYVGRPGTGKTKAAYAICPTLYAFPIGKDLWSDGYNGEKTVLLDDFSGGMRLVDALRFLDRYPILIPKKGSFNWWCPNLIIITTNVHPSQWYDYTQRNDSAAALRRRIHAVFDFDNLDDVGDPTQLDVATYWYLPDVDHVL